MNDYLKSFGIGVAGAVCWYAILYTPVFRPDPMGLAFAPIALVGGIGVLGLILGLSYVCERWLLKMRPAISAVLASLFGLGAFVIIARRIDSEWFGESFVVFGFHALFVCVPALLFLFVRLATKGLGKSPAGTRR